MVACGGSHTAFVSEDNTVWMCGRGRDGQLGIGNQKRSASFNMVSPVDLIKFKEKKSNKEGQVIAIALGSNHSVAHVTF